MWNFVFIRKRRQEFLEFSLISIQIVSLSKQGRQLEKWYIRGRNTHGISVSLDNKVYSTLFANNTVNGAFKSLNNQRILILKYCSLSQLLFFLYESSHITHLKTLTTIAPVLRSFHYWPSCRLYHKSVCESKTELKRLGFAETDFAIHKI